MSYGNHPNQYVKLAVDDCVGISLKQIASSPVEMRSISGWSLLDGFKGCVQLGYESVSGTLASLRIPSVCLRDLAFRVGIEFKWLNCFVP